MIWAGVDVGGRVKGFHAAAVDETGIVAGPQRISTTDGAVDWLRDLSPQVVALDSPKSCAPPGEKSRKGERSLMREVCGIRWTPEEGRLEGNPYYEWIVCGRELYMALERVAPQAKWHVIEVFPTASFTVWAKGRGRRTRAAWTRNAIADLAVPGLPARRLSQDDRDAIAAALTARLHSQRKTREFGEIVVPTAASLVMNQFHR
jgi:predicted nuclease with RNAse H fold